MANRSPPSPDFAESEGGRTHRLAKGAGQDAASPSAYPVEKETGQRRASSRLRRMGGGPRRTEPKPLVKLRPASPPRNVANRNRDGFLLADEDHEPLAASDAGVEEISLQHCVVLGEDRDDHGGIFGALALVDGGGIGGNQGVKLAEAVVHRAPVEARHEFARVGSTSRT